MMENLERLDKIKIKDWLASNTELIKELDYVANEGQVGVPIENILELEVSFDDLSKIQELVNINREARKVNDHHKMKEQRQILAKILDKYFE